MPALVGHMARLVDGIDVASGGELTVALDAGADPREISFAGPGKSEAELRAGGRRRHARQRRIDARDAACWHAHRGRAGRAGARRACASIRTSS